LVHDPVLAVSLLPSCGVPLIVGAVVFEGGAGGGGGEPPELPEPEEPPEVPEPVEPPEPPELVTGPTCELVAELDPPPFVAVTTTSMLVPTSVELSVYVEPVAPLMSLHVPDVQSCH
jgi:hypothetical protein